jgi:hypothetical protein
LLHAQGPTARERSGSVNYGAKPREPLVKATGLAPKLYTPGP